jgi:uncharacterized radical SAM superfamily Fe-S cluster-containing enzyme
MTEPDERMKTANTSLGKTKSICPECRKTVDAETVIRDNKVYLCKHCPEHGWSEAIVSSDADWYLKSLNYNKPEAAPDEFTTIDDRGCPDDCGLYPEHQQHTCLALIEITTRCNLVCPTCFADSVESEGYDLSVEQVEEMLDYLIAAEGEPEIVQISGGEPTIHPRFIDIVAAVYKRNIKNVIIHTNGIELALDPDLVQQLVPYGPLVYLQFDGFKAAASSVLRGMNLTYIKEKSLDNLAKAGLRAILVATVLSGVNDNEIGDILRYGLSHPAVLGVAYQPVTFSGRHFTEADPLHRITLPDILHMIEEQTDGMFKVSDFFPVSCLHPACAACTYAFIDRGEVTPLPRLPKVGDYLNAFSNHTSSDIPVDIRQALEALWSMAAFMGGDRITSAFLKLCPAVVPLSKVDQGSILERFFSIQVHSFMDQYTFDIKRLMGCCINQVTPDGRTIPFCAYNCTGYREQVRQLQGVP